MKHVGVCERKNDISIEEKILKERDREETRRRWKTEVKMKRIL